MRMAATTSAWLSPFLQEGEMCMLMPGMWDVGVCAHPSGKIYCG